MKKLILLIGPKGAGKSYIGNQISSLFTASFFRIEEIWQRMKEERVDFLSDEYMEEGLSRSFSAIEREFNSHDILVIESTATFDRFADFLSKLRDIAKVYLIKVSVPLDKCSERIKTRDQTLHVPVSDDMIESINQKASAVDMDWDLIIVNDPFVSAKQLKSALYPFFIDG